MKNIASTACAVILCIATVIFILTFSIGLPIYVRPFYYLQIEPLGIPEATGYSAEEIRDAFDEVMDYLTRPNKEFGTGVFAYSEEGKAHFADCKLLFSLNGWGLVISAAAVLTIFILHRKKAITLPSLRGYGMSMMSGVAMLLTCTVVGVLASLDFNRAFEIFHKIFFPGKDNWLFDPYTDEIILALPQAFFMNCAILIGASILLCSAALIVFGIVRKKRSGKS